MERISKYCRELQRINDLEEISSCKASICRKKILKLLITFDAEPDCGKLIELFWRTAYYNPLAHLRKSKDVDCRWLSLMVSIFCGELLAQIAASPQNLALYNLYLGDLHRYLPDESAKSLSSFYYQKSIEANPDMGQPFNQLALNGDEIDSVRYFLRASSSKIPFRSSFENLKQKLSNEPNDSLLNETYKLISACLIMYSKGKLSLCGAQFLEEVRSLDDVFLSHQLPKIIQTLSLANRVAAHLSSDDAFIGMSSAFADTCLFLLNKIHINLADSDEEEELVVVKSRRRGSSPSSHSSHSEDNYENSESETVNFSKAMLRPPLWPLAICCEWLLTVSPVIQELRDRKTPVPALLTDQITLLVDKLIEKLNESISLLLMDLDQNEETSWILHGPSNGRTPEEFDRSVRQTSFWATKLCSSSTSSVDFDEYFRRKNVVSDSSSSLLTKMGQLKSEEDRRMTSMEDWLPVYIVIDESVIINHLSLLRPLVSSKRFLPVVPSFVLAILDKMKGSSPYVRNAMRFIQQRQSLNELQVIESTSHEQCCKKLCDSTLEGNTKITTAVVLLVTDIENYMSIDIPACAVHHIESFCDSWNKGQHRMRTS